MDSSLSLMSHTQSTRQCYGPFLQTGRLFLPAPFHLHAPPPTPPILVMVISHLVPAIASLLSQPPEGALENLSQVSIQNSCV